MDRDLLLRCLDLSALQEGVSVDHLQQLCAKAVQPGPGLPPVAAVCVLPPVVSKARKFLFASSVRVATVDAFPDGRSKPERRSAEIRRALAIGAQEIDSVLSPTALIPGGEGPAVAELKAARAACDEATILKVILETGRLTTDEHIRSAALIAMRAGADFVKTSTGTIEPGATPEAAVVMMRVARFFAEETGRMVGIKVSGGVRTGEQAQSYLDLLLRELGSEWATPERFRIGSSSLLDDLVGEGV